MSLDKLVNEIKEYMMDWKMIDEDKNMKTVRILPLAMKFKGNILLIMIERVMSNHEQMDASSDRPYKLWYYDEEEFDFADGKLCFEAQMDRKISYNAEFYSPCFRWKQKSGAVRSIWFQSPKTRRLSSGRGRRQGYEERTDIYIWS